MMLLSVLITNYNYEAYAEALNQSVLASVYEPTEIIVVDDGSTGSSLEITYRLATKHPSIVRMYQENSG